MVVVNHCKQSSENTGKAKIRLEVSGGEENRGRRMLTGHKRKTGFNKSSGQDRAAGVVVCPVPRDYSFKMNKKREESHFNHFLLRVEENKFISWTR